MHFRLQLWMALFAFVAVAAVRAQAPAAAANGMPPGQIKAVKVVGSVKVVLNDQTTQLHDNDSVPQAAKVVTEGKSGVILVFSNGATTQLGEDTTLVIDEFLQDPFSQQVSVAALTAEPTVSHTRLHLNKGELIGNVKHLNRDKGSTFTIDTPVGAAGIRGTTFRIVFRPTGTGMAFAVFSISTVEGNVAFSTGGAQGQQPTTAEQREVRSRGGAVPVITGQEVVVTVSVDTNPITGQVTVTAPIQVATTTPLNPVVRASIVSQATTMATTVEQSGTTFTPPGSTSGGTSSGSNSSSSSSSSTDSTQKSDSQSSGDGTSGTSGGSTSSTSSSSSSSTGGTTSSGSTSGSTSTGAASTLTSSIAGGRQINTTPGFTTAGTQTLTPGAGR